MADSPGASVADGDTHTSPPSVSASVSVRAPLPRLVMTASTTPFPARSVTSGVSNAGAVAEVSALHDSK